MRPFIYHIDIIEACNLRCPSCPQGNFRDANRAKGMMEVATFEAIVEKITHETPVEYIGLYSWTEPLLHPQLPKFIEIVKAHGFRCQLSSNLNLVRNLEEVLRAGPDNLTVSLSGFYQKTYEQTHRGGNIETVKANMRKLRELMDAMNSSLQVTVAYHKYRHNLGDDLRKMKALCKELRFDLNATWAFLMPLEKMLAYYQGNLPEEDQALVKLMVINPDEQKAITMKNREDDCALRRGQTMINADGSVALCCAVFDSQYNIAPSFLEVSHKELQKRKYKHPLCATCMAHAIHKTSVYDQAREWDVVANRNLLQERRTPVRLGAYARSVVVNKAKRALRPLRPLKARLKKRFEK